MWFFFALTAAFLWGLVYLLDEHIYHHISVLTTLAITTFSGSILFTILAFTRGHLAKDLTTIFAADHRTLLMIMVVIGATVAAELCIGLSIANKNATVAGLVEISYPLFIALIGYVLLRENNLSLPTAVGALLIFSGIVSIYIFNR